MPRASDAKLELELRSVSMGFRRGRDQLSVLENIDLHIEAASFISIVGPNGCGKTTLVRLIAGLIQPSSGSVLHQGRRIARPDRSRLLMFQQPTLFPWLRVDRNLDLALRAKGVPRRERSPIIQRHLALVGLESFATSYPRQLSGGMLQRAELARALAVGPRVLLMDEPFAAVDALSRLTLQEDLARFRVRDDSAYVMVTHDVAEAVFLGDRVVLLSARPGRVKQIFDIPWPKLRSPHIRQTPRFAQICNEILDGLREEIGAVGTASAVPRRTAVG